MVFQFVRAPLEPQESSGSRCRNVNPIRPLYTKCVEVATVAYPALVDDHSASSGIRIVARSADGCCVGDRLLLGVSLCLVSGTDVS